MGELDEDVLVLQGVVDALHEPHSEDCYAGPGPPGCPPCDVEGLDAAALALVIQFATALKPKVSHEPTCQGADCAAFRTLHKLAEDVRAEAPTQPAERQPAPSGEPPAS